MTFTIGTRIKKPKSTLHTLNASITGYTGWGTSSRKCCADVP